MSTLAQNESEEMSGMTNIKLDKPLLNALLIVEDTRRSFSN